ncbi:Protein of unknown function [Azotobacter beijerinckii]|uniref:DUF2946 domain-containing protein n=1 Tax=Azotobacter beijerinckii TaxID=170623 RepID=A0A1H6Z774_9GAMM|nr:DUF2946 family protein [Azotobacter beijerinckii]SEJ45400.1 Protein of unknown function [Azotobacter beijerinckii]
MDSARNHRSLIAWMLYFSILLSTLHCSIGHGQSAGFSLAGVGGLFCSAMGHAGPTLDGDLGDPAPDGTPAFVSCPLCSVLALVDLALLFVLGTWLRPPRQWCRRLAPCGKAPPRQHWPPANPRAP